MDGNGTRRTRYRPPQLPGHPAIAPLAEPIQDRQRGVQRRQRSCGTVSPALQLGDDQQLFGMVTRQVALALRQRQALRQRRLYFRDGRKALWAPRTTYRRAGDVIQKILIAFGQHQGLQMAGQGYSAAITPPAAPPNQLPPPDNDRPRRSYSSF